MHHPPDDLQALVDAGAFDYEIDQPGIMYAPVDYDFTFYPRRGILPTTKGSTELMTPATMPHALWHSTVMRLDPDVAYYAWGGEIMLLGERVTDGVLTWSASVGGWRMEWKDGATFPALSVDPVYKVTAFPAAGALLRWRKAVAFIERCRAERAAGVDRPVTAAERCQARESALLAAMPAGLSKDDERAHRHGVELRAWRKVPA